VRLHEDEVIERYRASGAWGAQTLLDTFAAHVLRHSSSPAVTDPPNRSALVGTEPRRLTWAELGAAVDALATELLRRGVQTDDVVLVQLPNVWELPAVFLAVARAGGIISPLPMQWQSSELRHVAETTDARVYIGAESFKGTDYLAIARDVASGSELDDLIGLSQLTAMASAQADTAALEARRPGADDVFSLCWTSGTEIDPKGCPLTHNNWRFLGTRLLELLAIPEGGRLLVTPPLVNMAGVGTSLVPWLLCGGNLVLHHPLDMDLLLDQMGEGAAFTLLVPALLNMIVKRSETERLGIGSFGTIATGSAPPSAHSLEQFRRLFGIEVVNLWGQNEGTVLIAGAMDIPSPALRADHFPWWGKEGIDWPSGVHGVDVKILDEEGQQLDEPGDVGELVYRSPSVFPGYYRRPDLTALAFTEEGFFRTGDLFRIIDDSHVAFFDRKKDIIIRGGVNISAAEIENLALGHPDILDAAAVAVPDEIMGERVCLFVVPRDQANAPGLEDIVSFIADQGVAAYKLPERLEVLDAIPRNPVGKILKATLRLRIPGGGTR
jgi:acyl-CoA synthetase (AMP-forming)/AMP-acid ligase II